jgi:hypothetical protein
MARYIKHPQITCPICRKVSDNPLLKLELIRQEEIISNVAGGQMIQRACPELSADDRELLISGMCLDCQKKVFR